jgi:hypothetical protein
LDIVATPEQTWLEAVSGKTGAAIWRYALAESIKIPSQYNRLGASLEAIAQPQIARLDGPDVVLCMVNASCTESILRRAKMHGPQRPSVSHRTQCPLSFVLAKTN